MHKELDCADALPLPEAVKLNNFFWPGNRPDVVRSTTARVDFLPLDQSNLRKLEGLTQTFWRELEGGRTPSSPLGGPIKMHGRLPPWRTNQNARTDPLNPPSEDQSKCTDGPPQPPLEDQSKCTDGPPHPPLEDQSDCVIL